ncbi:MAG: TRAM domain-containing protein, partial [Halanaerobium sp. MSAO_Bac5]
KNLDAKVLTNDYNLNKVAELQGVNVLNINELANAVKPVVLPGEQMDVKVIKEGKENGQGVAYLDDGTMIVIEDGVKYIGDDVSVLVTSILQTAAGRMIFARPKTN